MASNLIILIILAEMKGLLITCILSFFVLVYVNNQALLEENGEKRLQRVKLHRKPSRDRRHLKIRDNRPDSFFTRNNPITKVNMTNNMNYEYVGPIGLGTPQQYFLV
jgi:hypothetical protein